MKYPYLILVLLFISCNSEAPITEKEQKEFAEMTQAWQRDIMQGAEKIEEILSKMDKNLKMWENDKIWKKGVNGWKVTNMSNLIKRETNK